MDEQIFVVTHVHFSFLEKHRKYSLLPLSCPHSWNWGIWCWTEQTPKAEQLSLLHCHTGPGSCVTSDKSLTCSETQDPICMQG